MCIEREKDNFKSREVNCLKECALALSQNKQDSENVVHFSIFSQMAVADDFINVQNDHLHKNCPNFPGSMTTSGLPNGYQ